MLIDSHCHLDQIDLSLFNNDMRTLLNEAKQNGVMQFLCVSIDLKHFPNVLAIAEAHDEVYASVGQHPNDELTLKIQHEELISLAAHPKVVAIGETGLDYYRTEENDIKAQQDRFVEHMTAARQTKKPLIIHTREAAQDTIAMMKAHHASEIGGVMHCFTESWDIAKACLDMNFYISLSGIVTFPKAFQCHELAEKIPLDRLLIETDSPYLAPVPFRGKTNHPALVKFVAARIAEIRGISTEAVENATTENFYRCFPAVKRL